MRLRVMTWNVHGFGAGTKQMADAVRAAEPDLVILNETGYLGFRLGRFSRRLEMEGSTGASLRWRIPNAVLARRPWRLIKGQVAVLPTKRRTVRRGAVMAQLGRTGVRLWVVAVHLGLSGQEREAHAKVLTDLLSGRHPTIVGGDLNEDAAGSAVRWISGRYWDVIADTPEASTFPAKDPRARIDYLFVSEGIHLDRSWTGDDRFARLSDHLPVFADLSVPG
jgi:endonuclease/exonuclease/phosphatase family metal-dependent hydrolase